MESTNAILLTESKTPGHLYDYEEYGVKQAYCVPPAVPTFEYSDMNVVGLDGQSLSKDTVQDLKNSENVFRYIKVDLDL